MNSCFVGIDSVVVRSFSSWSSLSNTRLEKFFSKKEIDYARSSHSLFAQRLAVRFAAKEAFLKALQQINPLKKLHLLTIAQSVAVDKNLHNMPYLIVNWAKLEESDQFYTTLSLTHTNCCATAVVMLYR